MVICNNCGATLTDALGFCSECGAAVQNRSAAVSSQTMERATESTLSYPIGHSSNQGFSGDSAAAVEPTTHPASGSSAKIVIVLGGVIVLLVVIIGLLALRRNASPDSPENLAASLRKAIDSGRLVDGSPGDAYSYFARLNALDPQNKAISEGKPRLLPQLRQLGDDVFRKRAELSLEILSEPDWVRAQHAYEWGHALEPADKAIEARWKYASANAARVQGRRAEAESDFKLAIQLDPSWALPQNDLGYLLALSGNYSDAIAFYERAINLKSDWDIPYNNMGTAYFYLKQPDRAIDWYKRAIEVNAQWATPHAWLGGILQDRNLLAEAIQEYQTTLNLYNPSRDRIKTTEIEERISKLQKRL
jgi:tetratricopeptide (TPR) repeat protein